MEIIIAIAVVLIALVIFFNRSSGADVNKDGKVDIADAKAAIDNTVAGLKETVDVNKDGKVDAADVKVAAKKATAGVKRAAGQAKKVVAKPKATKTKKV